MVRRTHERPGPKPAKESQIIRRKSDLGESSTCESDDTVANQTDTSLQAPESSGANRPQLSSEVRSTDGEYSQIRQLSPRRCSTMKDQSEQSGSSKTKKAANAPTAQIQQKELQKKATKQKETDRTEASTSAAAAANETSTVTRRPRKQRNPRQRERRFWTEVTKLQNRLDCLTPKLPFSRLVREIMLESSTEVTKITAAALSALQHSSELYVTQRLQDAYMLTLFRGRVTLDVKDMRMMQYLKQNLQ